MQYIHRVFFGLRRAFSTLPSASFSDASSDHCTMPIALFELGLYAHCCCIV
jgi:hypothetical protein